MSDCIIKKAIKEQLDKIINESVDKKCYEKFGNLLFGGFSFISNNWYKGKHEPNTKFEQDVWEKLSSYVTSNKRTPGLEKALKELYNCRKSYPRELDPKTRSFWRGVNYYHNSGTELIKQGVVTHDWLKEFNFYDYKEKWILMSDDFTYIPQNIVEGWSTSEARAINFMLTTVKAGTLIHADIPKTEIIMNPSFTNYIAYEEYESIRFVETPIKHCHLYMKKKTIEHMKKIVEKYKGK